MTFRGYGKGDIIGVGERKNGSVSLDDFCKNALMQGLEYQISSGRGFIPAGLIEEIRALAMPPIPWDVKLAKWFDDFFAPIEKHRTYARPSRRQASTPDIPRPRYFIDDTQTEGRTFGVVIDTSGSMSAKDIGIALGAIASYADAKDVLMKAISIAPEYSKIISNLGYLYLKEGDKAQAQKYFTAVLEFDPNDRIAAAELAKLEVQD